MVANGAAGAFGLGARAGVRSVGASSRDILPR